MGPAPARSQLCQEAKVAGPFWESGFPLWAMAAGGEGCEGCGVGVVLFFSFCFVVVLAVKDLNCIRGWEMGGG